MSPSLDWVFTLAAAVLAVGGCVLVVFALFRDRSRGRRRCPGCWYSLEGAAADAAGGFTCPECGRGIASEWGLLRTRRRWRLAAVGMVFLLVAGVLVQIPRARVRGWMYLIPDRVIFNAIPIGGIDGVFGEELERRLGSKPWPGGTYEGTLSDSRRAALLRRAVAGNVLARPIGPAWRESYGRLLREKSWNLYMMNDPSRTSAPTRSAELAAAVEGLSHIPYELTVRTREKWPKGMAPEFEFKVDQWWTMGTADQVTLEWATRPGGSSGKSRGGRGQFSLPIKDTGPVTVDMAIDVQQTDYSVTDRTARSMGKEKRSVTYTTADSIDDIIKPVSDAIVDGALRAGFALREQTPGDLMIDTHALALKGCDDVAFGVSMEVAHNGRPIMTAHARWLGGAPTQWTFGSVDTVGDWKETRKYIEDNAANPGWTVHVSTDEAWALALIDARRYWKGDMTFPVTVNVGPLIWTTRTSPPVKK